MPPGTNGGVSALGLYASLAGGVFVGLVYSITVVIAYIGDAEFMSAAVQVVYWAIFGGAAGLFGSLLDSLLGATVQATYFDKSLGRVIPPHQARSSPQHNVQHICGAEIMNNDVVNLVALAVTAVVFGFGVAPLVF